MATPTIRARLLETPLGVSSALAFSKNYWNTGNGCEEVNKLLGVYKRVRKLTNKTVPAKSPFFTNRVRKNAGAVKGVKRTVPHHGL